MLEFEGEIIIDNFETIFGLIFEFSVYDGNVHVEKRSWANLKVDVAAGLGSPSPLHGDRGLFRCPRPN